jgi:hypothetical protein
MIEFGNSDFGTKFGYRTVDKNLNSDEMQVRAFQVVATHRDTEVI